MRRRPRNRWFKLAGALAFHAFAAGIWLVVSTLAVAIAVGANPRSEEPSDAAFLTALAIAGVLWLVGMVLIVWRWRESRSLLGVPIAWAGAASVAALLSLALYPRPSRPGPVSYPQVKPAPALRALGKLAFAIPSDKGSTSDIFTINADGTGLANVTGSERTKARLRGHRMVRRSPSVATVARRMHATSLPSTSTTTR